MPLWLAMELKKQSNCRIQCPEFMGVEFLMQKKKEENESPVHELQDMPTHYMEIASLLFQHAGDDVQNADRVRSLLEDIENLRQHKVRRGLQAVGEQQTSQPLQFVKLNNASAMELHAIRPLLLSTLGEFLKLYSGGGPAGGAAAAVPAQAAMGHGRRVLCDGACRAPRLFSLASLVSFAPRRSSTALGAEPASQRRSLLTRAPLLHSPTTLQRRRRRCARRQRAFPPSAAQAGLLMGAAAASAADDGAAAQDGGGGERRKLRRFRPTQ